MSARTKNASFEEEIVWKVLDKMYENKSTLVQHHFDSYEHFMCHRVQHIIDSFNPMEVCHEYDATGDRFNHVVSVRMHNPRYVRTRVEEANGSETIITPMIARRRQLSYVANVVVDLDCKFKTYNAAAEAYHVETKDILNVCIGKLPIMIRSSFCVLSEHPISLGSECMYDYGGYFIIQGTEKVLVSQDRLAENKVQVFTNNKATPFSVIAEVRSITIDGVVPKTTVVKVSNKETCMGFPIKANVHHVKVDVPIGIVFKAFGVESDKNIVDMICYAQGTQHDANAVSAVRKFIEASMWESASIAGQEEALAYLSQHLNVSGYAKEQMSNPVIRTGILRKLLATECLPHVGEDFHKKAMFLAFMTNKLVACTVGLQPFDDRDSYINKKVDCSGHLLTALTKQYMSKMVKDFRNGLQKEINSTNASWRASKSLSSILSRVNIYKLVKPTTITQGINYAMSTGNWHLKQSVKVKSGVAQVLNRMNYIATLSHMRRVNTTIEKSGRLVQPRKVHSTNFGIICPCECFHPETPVLTWDGYIKEAKDIVVGDHLIDDLGNAVRVKSTCSGFKRMYEVVPDKTNFMSYTVTDNHILTLKDANDTTTTIDVTIETYLSLPDDVRQNLFVFKSDGINWEKKEVAVDPYVFGTSVVDDKHIPLDYLVNDRATRLAVLAGLVDTVGSVGANGHEIRITQCENNHMIIRDAAFLAMSLGFSCHMNDGTYEDLTITGSKLYEIPTVVPSKKLAMFDDPVQEKMSRADLMSSFELFEKSVQPFVGWQLEGSGRFLLKDMSVSHNTPEGASVGLVKNMALTACITCASSPLTALRIVRSQDDFVPCKNSVGSIVEFSRCTPVVINGDIVGGVKSDPVRLFRILKDSKRRGVLHIMTSVSLQAQGILVNTESGRCSRPLFVVDRDTGDLNVSRIPPDVFEKITWMQMVVGDASLGVPPCVEFLDTDEQNSSMIAMKNSDLYARKKGSNYPPKYTHCEIHPCLMLGVAASCIPFSDHNQSPRNCYQSSMCKQAIGVHLTNHGLRFDAVSHVLVAPQSPLVRTRTASILNNDSMPWGVNVIVAIACFTGYNQEDAIIMNKSSVERGMFHTVCYKSHKEVNMKNHSSGQEEIFCKVENTENRPFNYDKLGADGFVPVDTYVETGDIIVGKMLPSKNGPPKDVSVAVKTNEHGFVDKVLVDVSNGDGYNFAKVCIRQTRSPVIGDKFASRHAQKGTVGILYDAWDMPFLPNGVVPDIIINPNCFVGETLVTTPNGLSKRIDSFGSQGTEKVCTFDDDVGGFVPSFSLGMEERGVLDTVKVTMADGRTLVCTPDHKFKVITEEGEYVYKAANDIVVGPNGDRVVMGIEGTEDVVGDDEKGWSLRVGDDFEFSFEDVANREKTLAFARILGYVSTDGTLCAYDDGSKVVSRISMGHFMDAVGIQSDVETVTHVSPTIQTSSGTYDIAVPVRLARAMTRIEGIMVGRRTTQEASLPVFLTEERCPKSVLREFLGAYFGGDGHAPYINKGGFICVKVSQSICREYQPSLVRKMETIIAMMKKVGVEARISRVRDCHRNTKLYQEHPRVSCEIATKSNVTFLKNIGFRHCTQKSARLTVAASYQRLHTAVVQQRRNMVDKVKEIMEKDNMCVDDCIVKARGIFFKDNKSLNAFYSHPTRSDILRSIKYSDTHGRHISVPLLRTHFPGPEAYIESLGCGNWFGRGSSKTMKYIVKRGDDWVPHFAMTVNNIVPNGIRAVYDIGVAGHHNFTADGVCVSNCIPSR